LAKALQFNKSLAFIDLYGNKIGEDGTTAFVEALQVNESLIKLYLKDNTIGGEGDTMLAVKEKT
jgi:Ran GTPase-activating protein (RanGAP) involved in mRNA processing and transport